MGGLCLPHINNCHSHEQLLWRKDLHENQPSRARSLNNPSASPGAVSAQVHHEVLQVLQKEMDNYNMWQLLGHRVMEKRLGHPQLLHLLLLFDYFVTEHSFIHLVSIQSTNSSGWGLSLTMKLKKEIKINKVAFQDEK